MKLKKNYVAAAALCLGLFPSIVMADSVPKDIALAKKAIVNMKAEKFWMLLGQGAISSLKLDSVQTEKAQKTFATNLKKSFPSLVNTLAKNEASHFTSGELIEIEKASEVKPYQNLLLNIVQGKPKVDPSTINPSDAAVINILGNLDHVKKFMAELGSGDASLKPIIAIAEQAVSASQ